MNRRLVRPDAGAAVKRWSGITEEERERFRFDLQELDSFFALAPTFMGGVFVAGV